MKNSWFEIFTHEFFLVHCSTLFSYTNVRYNKRFDSSFSASCRKSTNLFMSKLYVALLFLFWCFISTHCVSLKGLNFFLFVHISSNVGTAKLKRQKYLYKVYVHCTYFVFIYICIILLFFYKCSKKFISTLRYIMSENCYGDQCCQQRLCQRSAALWLKKLICLFFHSFHSREKRS